MSVSVLSACVSMCAQQGFRAKMHQVFECQPLPISHATSCAISVSLAPVGSECC